VDSFHPVMYPDRADHLRKIVSDRTDTGGKREVHVPAAFNIPCSVREAPTVKLTPNLAVQGVQFDVQVFFPRDPVLAQGDLLAVGPRRLRVERCLQYGTLDLIHWRADCSERR
jgi:hypothetical protein